MFSYYLKAPQKNMADLITKTIQEAKDMISKVIISLMIN